MSNSSTDSRAVLRRRFLVARGYEAGVGCEALAGDASLRRYFRVAPRDGVSCLLMDSPQVGENLEGFVAVARHLERLGLRVPRIDAVDWGAGLALIEDFGDDTFTRLLANGADERSLYELAVDAMLHLQRHPQATAIELPRYDTELLLNEALLLMDWFYPEVHGSPPSAALRDRYIALWLNLIHDLPPLPPVLVLRDFHVDNLMMLAADERLQRCGLLDFQGALLGSPAYDLMSLLEDARRDLAPDTKAAMRARYLQGRPELPHDSFDLWFTTLAAQRHCKVIGLFTRLHRRDRKDDYRQHIPRVLGLLKAVLAAPSMAPLGAWLQAQRLLPPAPAATPAAPPL